jgi:hypothetical protein
MDDDIDHCLRWKNWLSAATLQEVLNIFGPLVLLNVFYLKIIRYFIHESLHSEAQHSRNVRLL